MEAVFENNCANALIVYGMFIVCSYLSGSIGIVRKNVTKDAVMVCICIITHTIFFIIIAPVSHYRGTPRFWAFFGLFFWLRLFAANADKYGYAVALLPSGQYAQPSALCSRFTASIRALFSSIKKAPSHYPFLRDTDVERSHVGDRTQNANPCPMPAEKLRR